MSLLIFGKNGQLARALKRSLIARGTPFSSYGRAEADLISDPDKSAKLIHELQPSAVINACAFTDVDGAEVHFDQANALNAQAPAAMAKACQSVDIPFIHISTDYVFDGTKKGPYSPNDTNNPVNAYGRSKAAGERAVIAAGGRSLIIRTSWVYDGQGKNFFTSMLNLVKTQRFLDLVDNQFGRPCYAGHLAEACLAALEHFPNSPEIYHLTNSGPRISWADFAQAIFEHADLHPKTRRVPDTHFPRPAQRPKNSHLEISDFERDFKHPMEPWTSGIEFAFHEFKRHAKERP